MTPLAVPRPSRRRAPARAERSTTDGDRGLAAELRADGLTLACGREVVVAGVRDHLEIWDATAWRDQIKEVEGSAELVAERLAAKQG